MTTAKTIGLALGLTLVLAAAGQEPPPAGDAEPKQIGLVEETGRRLVQLDVSVSGPDHAIRDLTREDFDLVVMGRVVDEFIVDAVCSDPSAPQPDPLPEPATTTERPGTPSLPRPPLTLPVTYLFYFDQHHLTLGGRQGAIDTARDLIPQLIQGGNRGVIVSAGQELETFAELSDDPVVLDAALSRLESDRTQWDPFPQEEESRIANLLNTLNAQGDTHRATVLAEQYAREERWRTEKALRLFSTVLGRLATLDPPKATVYFADTMRREPGAHYLSFFGNAERSGQATAGNAFAPGLDTLEAAAFMGSNPFDRVIEEAAAHGIRLYTVQAQGLVLGESINVQSRGPIRDGKSPIAAKVRINQAQDSLAGLANETGGESFLNGVSGKRIARRIQADLACLYLISFNPEGYPLDEPLRVLVRANRDKVKAQTRGLLVVQSEERRRTSMLLAAFANSSADTPLPLRGVLVPTGYEDGRFMALVQIGLPGTALSSTEWDMGASLVSRGRVRDDVSGRIGVESPGVPVILERSMRFAPGPFELMMVAHETRTDQIVSAQLEGEWPDPDDSRASLAPVALLQPAAGAFLRDGEVKRNGALARADDETVRTDFDLALIGLVCRAKGREPGYRLTRRLVGDTAAEFSPIELEFADERCARFSDLVPGGMLTEGSFVYEIRVLDDGEELAVKDVSFVALAPERFAEANRP